MDRGAPVLRQSRVEERAGSEVFFAAAIVVVATCAAALEVLKRALFIKQLLDAGCSSGAGRMAALGRCRSCAGDVLFGFVAGTAVGWAVDAQVGVDPTAVGLAESNWSEEKEAVGAIVVEKASLPLSVGRGHGGCHAVPWIGCGSV